MSERIKKPSCLCEKRALRVQSSETEGQKQRACKNGPFLFYRNMITSTMAIRRNWLHCDFTKRWKVAFLCSASSFCREIRKLRGKRETYLYEIRARRKNSRNNLRRISRYICGKSDLIITQSDGWWKRTIPRFRTNREQKVLSFIYAIKSDS